MPVSVVDTTRPASAGPGRARRSRRGVRVVGAAAVGLFALTSCTSDPGPKRVAEDIIRAESVRNPELDEECLLTALNRYSADDLQAISDDLASSNTDRNAEGEASLRTYELQLAACL